MVLEGPSRLDVSRWDSSSPSVGRMTLDPLASQDCLSFALLVPESVSSAAVFLYQVTPSDLVTRQKRGFWSF